MTVVKLPYRKIFKTILPVVVTYESLTHYHRESLPATNFWRIANGMEPIEVPLEDKHYHHYFTEKQANQAKQILIEKQRQK